MTSAKPPTLDEYLEALERMKKSPRDRVAALAEFGVTGLVAAGGAVAAVVAGASMVSLLGFTLVVAATPIGWVLGAAVIAGGLAFWLARLVRGGGRYDAHKELNIREVEERIRTLRGQSRFSVRHEGKMKLLLTALQCSVAARQISQDDSTKLIEAVERGRMPIDRALADLHELARESAKHR
jgi:hypothetical protein